MIKKQPKVDNYNTKKDSDFAVLLCVFDKMTILKFQKIVAIITVIFSVFKVYNCDF